MKLWVGLTDNDWFDVVSHVPGIDEVNFWKPGGGFKAFEAQQLGEQNIFELHSTQNEERQKIEIPKETGGSRRAGERFLWPPCIYARIRSVTCDTCRAPCDIRGAGDGRQSN